MTFCREKCSRRRAFVSIWFFGFVILVVGITVNVIVGNLLQDAINRAVIFRNPNSTASTERDRAVFNDWVSNVDADDAALLYSFTLFDVVGEDSGSLAFREVGPFVYQAHVTKYCVQFGNADTELSYNEHVRLSYRQDLSGTVPLDGVGKFFALAVDPSGCTKESLEEQAPGSHLSEHTIVAGVAPNHVDFLQQLPLGTVYGAACGFGAQRLVNQSALPNMTASEQRLAVGREVLPRMNAYFTSSRRSSFVFVTSTESERMLGELLMLLAQPLNGTHPQFGRFGFVGYEFFQLVLYQERLGPLSDPAIVPFVDLVPCVAASTDSLNPSCTTEAKVQVLSDIVGYFVQYHTEDVLKVLDATGDISRLQKLERPDAALVFQSGRVAAKSVANWLFESNHSLSASEICPKTDSLDNVRRHFAPSGSPPQSVAFVRVDSRPAPGISDCPAPSPPDLHPFSVKVHTGKGDIERINDALEFQGRSFVASQAWATEQNPPATDWTYCLENVPVRGKVIGRWPPGEQTTLGFTPSPAGTKSFVPLVWSETLLRSVSFEFLESTSVRGVDAKRFRLSDAALSPDASFNQSYEGVGTFYCSNRHRSSFFRGDGAASRLVLTKARYVGVSPDGSLAVPVLAGTTTPDASEVDTTIDIEPLSGLAISASEKVLFSLVAPRSSRLSDTAPHIGSVPPAMLQSRPNLLRFLNQTAEFGSVRFEGELQPLYMLERKAELSPEQASKIKADLYAPIAIKDTVFLVTVPLGGLMILFAVAGLVANGSRDRQKSSDATFD